jgi:hypothetical protein
MKPAQITRSECPVIGTLENIENSTRELARSMRQLRRDLRACDRCVDRVDCPVLAEFHSTIDLAARQVLREWGWL